MQCRPIIWVIYALPPRYFFHGAFAPSFIWRRRPWYTISAGRLNLGTSVSCICCHVSVYFEWQQLHGKTIVEALTACTQYVINLHFQVIATCTLFISVYDWQALTNRKRRSMQTTCASMDGFTPHSAHLRLWIYCARTQSAISSGWPMTR